MKKEKQNLDKIKRKAKALKKELNISHTKALELIARELGYSNWKHCQRTLIRIPIREIRSEKKEPQLSFTDWLKKHKNRNSPLGDLATDMLRDPTWPSYNTLEAYRDYLSFKNAYFGAIAVLERSWKRYKAYLQRKIRPTTKKANRKKSIVKRHDPRKIVYIKNVNPLHYRQRTVEKFKPGDEAWISWDGRKALPVEIVKADDRHYTFKIVRPLKKAGDQHYLFLDEVRSTPELACINCVTL